MELLLQNQDIGPILPFSIVKYAIRQAIAAGVPANTIVLLLLLPVVVAVIAATRHIVGIRGFGIFLPAALSVVFLALGPIIGLILFLIIVSISTLTRLLLKKIKFRLQYLPRMALILWAVVIIVLALLFAIPYITNVSFVNISIFPLLILVLLSEDFTRVQTGKSIKTAINLTTETLILALVSYLFLTLQALQQFAILNPEILLISVLVFNIIVGKYSGLRVIEFWRFRKLINSK